MKLRIYRPGTTPRRRYFYAVATLALATTSVLAMGPSQAVHDEGFALQGNLFGTGIDWEDLFDVTGSPTVTTPKASLPGAFTAAAFAKDWVLPDTTGYATGSKDELPISLPGGGDWQCQDAQQPGCQVRPRQRLRGGVGADDGRRRRRPDRLLRLRGLRT